MYGQLALRATGAADGTHLRRSAPCRNRSTADAARIFYGLALVTQGQFFLPGSVLRYFLPSFRSASITVTRPDREVDGHSGRGPSCPHASGCALEPWVGESLAVTTR